MSKVWGKLMKTRTCQHGYVFQCLTHTHTHTHTHTDVAYSCAMRACGCNVDKYRVYVYVCVSQVEKSRVAEVAKRAEEAYAKRQAEAERARKAAARRDKEGSDGEQDSEEGEAVNGDGTSLAGLKVRTLAHLHEHRARPVRQ